MFAIYLFITIRVFSVDIFLCDDVIWKFREVLCRVFKPRARADGQSSQVNFEFIRIYNRVRAVAIQDVLRNNSTGQFDCFCFYGLFYDFGDLHRYHILSRLLKNDGFEKICTGLNY